MMKSDKLATTFSSMWIGATLYNSTTAKERTCLQTGLQLLEGRATLRKKTYSIRSRYADNVAC